MLRSDSSSCEESDSSSDESVENYSSDTDEEDFQRGDLTRDLKGLLLQQRLSDVSFVVGDAKETIYAHKLILASSSDVLASMVYPNGLSDVMTCSGRPLRIRIEGTDPSVFKLMLEAIYTDEVFLPEAVALTEQTIGPCIRLSKKYAIEKLQLLCSDFLREGITVGNACAMFDTAPQTLGNPEFGQDFIAEHAKSVFQTDGFLSLQKHRLLQLLALDGLQIREVDLFDAVCAWGEHQLKHQKNNSKDVNLLKEILKDLMPLVRFPLFKLRDFSEKVDAPGFLDDADLLELYSYITWKESSDKREGIMIKTKFITKPRKVWKFVWKAGGTKGKISQDGMTFSSCQSGYSCCRGELPMKPKTGKYYWECVAGGSFSQDWACGFGICMIDLNLENYLSSSKSGWAYFNQGCKCHASGASTDRYGDSFLPGDKVGCLYDSNLGNLTYFLNGKNLGLAYKGITEEVYPAGHLNTGASFTIIATSEVPQEAF